jgi:hypothetical protein
MIAPPPTTPAAPAPTSPATTAAERFADFLGRRRVALLSAWVAHAFLLHYFVLGYISWDGLGYRGVGVIELVQHGHLDASKYSDWSFEGYVPFVELIHAPFLWLFKLPGLLIGFPLVAFPLAVAAVYAFCRELTGDARAATFGALAYAALPMMNAQPFGGYVDFAICGLLAFFLYAVLRLRSSTRPGRAFALLAVASALFTMSRTQAVYIALLLLPVLLYVLFCHRRGLRVRIARAQPIALAVAAVLTGAIPAIAIQVVKYLHHGTPTYPLRFQIFGLKIGNGVSMRDYFVYAGLADDSRLEMARAFVRGWLFDPGWPIGGFYDSRHMGAGLVMVIALLLLPGFLRRAPRLELWLVGTCVAVSIVAHDYVHPRWAYTLSIAVIVVIARALPALLTARRGGALFWVASVGLLLHLLRPEVDLAQTRSPPHGWARLNVSESRLFVPGGGQHPFPSRGAPVVIVDSGDNYFVVPLFGRDLSNHVVATVPRAGIGDACRALRHFVDDDPRTMFVDPGGATASCDRACVARDRTGKCRGYTLNPPAR